MGDTRQVVDGEDRSTIRPLRPAAPPAGSAGAPSTPPLPQPRVETADTKTDQVTKTGRAAKTGGVLKDDQVGQTEQIAKAGAATKPTDGKGTAGPAVGTATSERSGKDAPVPTARELATGATRAARAWARRPSGRVVLPGVFLLALVASTAAAGALLVPGSAPDPEPVAVDATATISVTAVPQGGALPAVTTTAVPGLPGATGLPGTPLPTGTSFPGGTHPTGPV
ncbi:MAG: murein transglycosylase, partial [Micromonospora sp.]